MRIGIVNDLAGVAELLKRMVGVDPANRVVWIARDGAEAVKLCAIDTPDLVLMDMVMPVMDGVESTRRIMATTPCPILIVTGSIGKSVSPVFEAMGHGALDALDTPLLGDGAMVDRAKPLLAKIATIARLVADKRARPRHGGDSLSAPGSPGRLVGIGSSAGGPAALATILKDLPADFPAAIVIVQHVDQQFAAGMAMWLDHTTALSVRVAEEGIVPPPARCCWPQPPIT